MSLGRTRVISGFQELFRLKSDHVQVREFVRAQAIGVPTLPPGFPFSYPYDSLIFHPRVDESLITRYHEIPQEIRPLHARALFRDLLPAEEEFCSIFTDGSVNGNNTGLGIYGPNGLRNRYHLSLPASVFTAEIRAILEGVRLLNEGDNTITLARIFTDSWSSLQALKNPRVSVHTHPAIIECRHMIHELLDKNIEVVLSWVPSHTGITGN